MGALGGGALGSPARGKARGPEGWRFLVVLEVQSLCTVVMYSSVIDFNTCEAWKRYFVWSG